MLLEYGILRKIMTDISHQHESVVACNEPEPVEGNLFVSAYPPFSYWGGEHLPAAAAAMQTPPAGADETPLGLYCHVPFCEQRCQFCYYRSYANPSPEAVDEYVDALAGELALYRDAPLLAGRKLDFAYFGGGTPSLLTASQISRLANNLQRSFSWGDAREITFECAPRTVTTEKLRALSGAGVTRVSLGVQQLDDNVLKANGRVHLVSDVEQALAAISRVGFDVVNIDLIVGLIGESDETFHKSLSRVIALSPESVTLYQLEIPGNTPLFRALRQETLPSPPATWQIKRARLAAAFSELEDAGYSVRSAYAAVRDPQAHRFVYQDAQYRGADLIGLGIASFSYLAGVHVQNLASFRTYFGRLENGRLPHDRAYALDRQERWVRELVLQLKLGVVALDYFRRKFGAQIEEQYAVPLSRFAARGWLTVDPDAVKLTREGLLRVDRMLPAFYLPRHREKPYW